MPGLGGRSAVVGGGLRTCPVRVQRTTRACHAARAVTKNDVRQRGFRRPVSTVRPPPTLARPNPVQKLTAGMAAVALVFAFLAGRIADAEAVSALRTWRDAECR